MYFIGQRFGDIHFFDSLMDRRTIILFIAIGIGAVLLIGVFVFWGRTAPSAPQGNEPGAAASSAVPKKSTTWTPAPANITVPEKGATVPQNVATPKAVQAAAVGSSANYRGYEVAIRGNAFSPDTVIVSKGDVAHIVFASVDADYDIVQPDYGVSALVPQSQTKTIQFDATAAGKFTFYCKSCGGPENGPVGYIIVVPK